MSCLSLIDENSNIWLLPPYNEILRKLKDTTLATHSVRLSYIIIDASNYGYVNINKYVLSYMQYAKKNYGIELNEKILLKAVLYSLKILSTIPIYRVGDVYFLVPLNKRSKFIKKFPGAEVVF